MADELPATPDRFRVVRRIGAGGMGVVYEAYDSRRSELVALKTLHHLDAESLYRFKREFRALADLSHPNLVTLYELFSNEEEWFFTMELVVGSPFLQWVQRDEAEPRQVPGDPTVTRSCVQPRALVEPPATMQVRRSDEEVATLLERVDTGSAAPFPLRADALPRVRDALQQLARGLVALHDAGWLHRDVKPSNVLVAEDGRVVILDFGVITELRARADDQMAGTPAYMAPEQARSEAPTPASDWYAFGVMLYEILSGRRPFEGGASTVLAGKLLGGKAPALAAIAKDAPRDLAALAEELLNQDPSARPTGRQVLARLGARLSSSPPPLRDATDRRDATELVGRADSLARLRSAFARVDEGVGQAVLVHGASGMGKTALIDAFLASLRDRDDVLVLRGRCYERESVPYKALDNLVDALCRHLVELPRSAVVALMPDDVVALTAAFPVLHRFDDATTTAEGLAGRAPLQAGNLHVRALRALGRLLGNLAAKKRLVLFVDDLQWGDVDSTPLLGSLVSPEGPPLLFLGSFRTEHRDQSPLLASLFEAARIGKGGVFTGLSVEALQADDLRNLARSLLAASGAPTEMADRIASEACGSPFFAQELARHAAASWARGEGSRGPMSLHDVVLSRAQRLSPEAQKVLEVVAVSGVPVPRRAIELAAEVVGSNRVFVELVRNHFIKAGSVPGQESLEVTHDAIREAVQSALPVERRRAIHLAVATNLESTATDRADVHRLAHHYFHAWPDAPTEKVIAACKEAAREATRGFAYDQAFLNLDRARTIAEQSNAPQGLEFDVLFADVAARTGHIELALQAMRRALPAAPSGVERAELRLGLAKVFLGQIDTEGSQEEVSRGLADLGTTPPRSSLPHLGWSLCLWLTGFFLSRVWTSRIGSARGVDRARARAKVALLLHAFKTAYFQMDRFLQLQAVLRLFPTAMRLGDSQELVEWCIISSVVAAIAGRPRLAERLGTRALGLATTMRDPVASARTTQYRAHSLHFAGEPEAASTVMVACLGEHGHWLENLDFLTAVADLAWNSLMRGYASLGWQWIEKGLERAAIDGSHSRMTEGHTYRCYAGPLLALLGRRDEGARHLDEFRALLDNTPSDRWRWAQWLAHFLLFQVETGNVGDVADEAIQSFARLGLSPRGTPLQIRHFYVAQASVRHGQLEQSDLADRTARQKAWREARGELARAATHPTLRAHLMVLEARAAVFEGDDVRSERRLREAERIAEATKNLWVLADVARLRARAATRRSDAAGARLEWERAIAYAEEQRWASRLAELRDEVP